MKPRVVLLIVLAVSLGLSPRPEGTEPASIVDSTEPHPAAVRFEAVPVYVDPQGQPLAAYQFELSATNARLTVVGLENGEHAAFADAPFYDTDAVQQGRADRIVVAAYSLLPGGALPQGPTRVATVMVQVQLPPDAAADTEVIYQLDLIAAGNPAGQPIPATLFRGAQP